MILEIGELPSKYWNIYWILELGFSEKHKSAPPERVFSVLNDTFEDDMDSSHADYIELSLQLQFNNRSRE